RARARRARAGRGSRGRDRRGGARARRGSPVALQVPGAALRPRRPRRDHAARAPRRRGAAGAVGRALAGRRSRRLPARRRGVVQGRRVRLSRGPRALDGNPRCRRPDGAAARTLPSDLAGAVRNRGRARTSVARERNVMDAAGFYRENGYYHARGVFDAGEVEEMRAAIEQILADVEGTANDENHRWNTAEKETVLKGFHNVQYHAAAFTRAVAHPGIVAVLTQLIGPNVQLHHTKMLVKPPEKGAPFRCTRTIRTSHTSGTRCSPRASTSTTRTRRTA